MFSTWVQNHPSDKLGTYSQTFLDILRLFLDFPRTFSEFVGRKQNYVGRFQNCVGRKINSVGHNPKNVPRNHSNNVLFYHKRRVVSLKRGKSLQKHLKLAIFKRAENRIIPNNFFWVQKVALNGRVEIVNMCCFCAGFWGGLRGQLGITRKWKMIGSCLLHNALHYNGLMTDWGFQTTPLSLADYIMRTASRTFLGWIFNIVLRAPPKTWNREC